jgi:osmotically-inducible protein OsmY
LQQESLARFGLLSKTRKSQQQNNIMKNRINGLSLLLCLGLSTAAVTLFTGCSNNESTATDRTAGQYVDDKTLTANVKTALSDNPDFKFGDVSVDTMNGTVQLSGFVNTEDQKSKAVEIAKGVQGVKDVQDKMTTKPGQ